MLVRSAAEADLDDIMRIYDAARQTMRERGNHAQWVNGYPQRSLIAGDIERGESFVVEGDDGCAHGAFMFAIGEDPTYRIIEDGNWLNDEPYGVIHRIGSDGRVRGVMGAATRFALERIDDVRVDTHADNDAMQHALAKEGFERCGRIYCEDGTPRIAFHLHRDS